MSAEAFEPVVSHATVRGAERFPEHCPNRLVRAILASFHEGYEWLVWLGECANEGVDVYLYWHPGMIRPVYPLINGDGFIVTLLAGDHYVELKTGRVAVCELTMRKVLRAA